MLISTDASIFEIEPKEVIFPVDREDLINTIRRLLSENESFTMRAGGTSIGGQAIGSGVLVDISKYLTNVLSFSESDKEVVVEPGVIQDDLNIYLESFNLKFAPDTSTSNRAMIGGMIGNNSCGSYSVYYGTTRDHVKSVEVILSDGSLVMFKDLSQEELESKLQLKTLEGDIYRFFINLLQKNKTEILDSFPDESLIRRNTGYALDELIRKHQPFSVNGKEFNLAPLICGSEGTLGVVVSAKLNLVDLPKYKKLIVAHFSSDELSLSIVEQLLDFNPSAVEYIDKPTLDASKNNIQQEKNRVWINGNPKSVLIIEFFSDTLIELTSNLLECQEWLLSKGAYHVGLIDEKDHQKVWDVRKAGLGLLMGKVGAKKAVAIIEDAAVPLRHLFSYYQDVKTLMRFYNINAVYYGHASVGLVHIRPELDLSNPTDQIIMNDIAKNISTLVKKYKGSLSGEHGDGRIRSPFLKEQFGSNVYQYLVDLKKVFDPNNLLNPGVIINDGNILNNLRKVNQPEKSLLTGFDWNKDISFYYATEKCSGAGTCRKSAGQGVMCPSYRATRSEEFSTRGRANLLRRALNSNNPKEELKNEELKKALELCLSCKACKKECPASVDMSRLKSEYLYQTKTVQNQFELWQVRNFGKILKAASRIPNLFNFLQSRSMTKKILGINRNLPDLQKETLKSWWNKNKHIKKGHNVTVWVICDLFTQYYDTKIGRDLINFLKACDVNIRLISYDDSIIAMISKGLLVEAKNALKEMKFKLKDVSENDYIIGIEPSETLVWRDDATSLLSGKLPRVLLFEELVLKLNNQDLMPKLKSIDSRVWVHTHCHQKALTDDIDLLRSLKLIPGIKVKMLNTGCCGMAGDFGYKYDDISKTIAHQSFDGPFKRINDDDILIATGTSCRKQISDVFQTKSIHLPQLFARTVNGEVC
jgi:FAD/FMN-containing dehydrogenase/Fe-S oxidoreductase